MLLITAYIWEFWGILFFQNEQNIITAGVFTLKLVVFKTIFYFYYFFYLKGKKLKRDILG